MSNIPNQSDAIRIRITIAMNALFDLVFDNAGASNAVEGDIEATYKVAIQR